jgi:hypothetical protein
MGARLHPWEYARLHSGRSGALASLSPDRLYQEDAGPPRTAPPGYWLSAAVVASSRKPLASSRKEGLWEWMGPTSVTSAGSACASSASVPLDDFLRQTFKRRVACRRRRAR